MTAKTDHEDWRPLLQQGIALLQQGQAPRAVAQLTRAQRLAPDERDILYWLGNASRMTGDADRAAKLFRGLLEQRPDDFDASFALAFLLREAGRPRDAADALLEAAAQPGLDAERLLQVAGFLRDSNQYEAAIKACEKAAVLRPGQADLQFKLGRLYQATGNFDRALDALRKAIEFDPSIGPAWTVLAQQKNFADADDPDFRRIEAATTRSLGPEADMCISFARGKALDDLGRWQDAWQQYERGNGFAVQAMPWDPDAWTAFVDRTIAAPVATGPEGADRRAVFVVGMPRSGTTLLEQMLDRHPDVHARGELNFLDHFAKQVAAAPSVSAADRRAMADMLWTQLRLEGHEDGVYIDKNPLNFRHLGLLFGLLPSARVVHVTRDPRDTGLSCYFQLFQHADAAFSNSLDHLAAFFAGYARLMTHWTSTYAERIYTIRYEDLVKESEETLAAALEFVGAGLDDAVLERGDRGRAVRTASVWQARQAVHAESIGRWRNYAQFAPGFFAELADIERRRAKP